MRTSLKEIERFVESKDDWIVTKIFEFAKAIQSIPQLPNEEFRYWRGQAIHKSDFPRNEDVAARKVFEEFVAELLPLLGIASLRYKELATRRMRRRWGSCRVDGKITLNHHLISTPDQCIKAVIAHELAHLVHLDHGSGFKQLVRSIMPSYDEADAELDTWTIVLSGLGRRSDQTP